MRSLLPSILAFSLLSSLLPASVLGADKFERALVEIDQNFDCDLGVCAIDTETGAVLKHNADMRFPMCSTAKVMIVGTILKRNEKEERLLDKQLSCPAESLVTYSPITEKYADSTLSVGMACEAALQYSDNTAANLLLDELGGPEVVTQFARSIGDSDYRLDRREPELNSALPGDERDTTTPEAMAKSLERLLLGDALAPAQRAQLREWMLGNTTGAKRIRAGVPEEWQVADKTGSGDYGTANDVGVVLRPGKKPLVIAIYTRSDEASAKPANEPIANAAWVTAGWAEE